MINVNVNRAVSLIEDQQKGRENTAAYMIGEQLKDIIRGNEQAAELVIGDLGNPDMSLEKCERKIKEYSDKQKRSNSERCTIP